MIMKRNALIFILIFISASSLFALSKEEINSENIASLLLDAGFKAYVDDEGDVTVHDEYDMKYWIIHYPEENMLFIQSGWNAKDGIDSEKAYPLVNESNRTLFLIRCWYDPVSRAFYADYDFHYPKEGLNDALLIDILAIFFESSDEYTDYLIGENAI